MKPGMNNSPHMSRASKTLGWFLADDIFDKKAPIATATVTTAMAGADTATKAPIAANGKLTSEDKKRRKMRKMNPKKHEYVPGQALSESSAASLEEMDEKQRVIPEAKSSDDFWVYDVATDGYYYEQNGAKGWRRRMPNSAMQKIKEQELAQLAANNGKMPTNPKEVPIAEAHLMRREMNRELNAQAHAQAAAQAHVLLQQAMYSSTPPLKYYDPNSDGFFYEMASVDGWKRRQPQMPQMPQMSHMSSNSSSSSIHYSRPIPAAAQQHIQRNSQGPYGTSPSLGSALARGQFPKNTVIDDSSASSSVSEDTAVQDQYDSLFYGAQVGNDSPFQSLSRPDSLSLRKESTKMAPGFDAERFIQDLSFSGMDPAKVLGYTPRASSDAWGTSSSTRGWQLPSTCVKTAASSAPSVSEGHEMDALLQGLEQIWATPTPIKN